MLVKGHRQPALFWRLCLLVFLLALVLPEDRMEPEVLFLLVLGAKPIKVHQRIVRVVADHERRPRGGHVLAPRRMVLPAATAATTPARFTTVADHTASARQHAPRAHVHQLHAWPGGLQPRAGRAVGP